MKPFTESLRYEYPLTPNDLVLDIGGFEGNFAAAIQAKYGCRVVIFEPCWQFAMGIRDRFKKNKSITVYSVAVGSESGEIKIGVRGDSTGKFTASESVQTCPVVDINDIVHEFGNCALLKLNCEGGEYEILERIIDCDLGHRFKFIQVQFHTVAPDYEKRRGLIRKWLAVTHNLQFDEPFVWEGWTLK